MYSIFNVVFRYQGTDAKIEQFQKRITTPLAFVMEILVIGTGKFQENENISRILVKFISIVKILTKRNPKIQRKCIFC